MVYAFNYDVWGLPIAEGKTQREIGRILKLDRNLISRQVRNKKRNKKIKIKFVEIKEEKLKEEKINKIVCYAVYDCKVEGEPIVQLFDTIKEVSFFLGCWDSSTKNLIKKGIKNRQGLKVARVEFEDD